MAYSQSLSGIVLSAKTSEAVPHSQVFLLDYHHNKIDSTTTGEDGRFRFNKTDNQGLLKVISRDYETYWGEVNGRKWIKVLLLEIIMEGSYWQPTPLFPWPPPLPSTKTEIPSSIFANCKNLGEVNRLLTEALIKTGYSDQSYFLVPAKEDHGFALATQLEQIDSERFPKKDPNRWNSNLINNKYVGWEYITATLLPNPGFFRVIVFIVTDIPFVTANTSVDQEVAQDWLREGASGFPNELYDKPFSRNYKIWALIYEYEQKKAEADAILLKPSKYTAKSHLEKSHLWNMLLKNK